MSAVYRSVSRAIADGWILDRPIPGGYRLRRRTQAGWITATAIVS